MSAPVAGPDREAQRRGAVKTALVLAVVAIGIYGWAILSRM